MYVMHLWSSGYLFHLLALATASKVMVVSESETDVMGLVLSVSSKLILVVKLMIASNSSYFNNSMSSVASIPSCANHS